MADTEHPNLAAALVAALAKLSVVDKGRTATVPMKAGGKYTYDYADLGDVVKLTRPALAEHGLVALTPIEEHDGGLKCTVVLLHASGERLDFGPFPFPRGHDAQSTGSAVTYYRRYALVAALGMAAGDDDDGANAKPAPTPAFVDRHDSDVGMNTTPDEWSWSIPSIPEHESILSILKVLTASQRVRVTDWWDSHGLPLTPSQKPAPRRLTEAQAHVVLDYLDGLDVQDDSAVVVSTSPPHGEVETPAAESLPENLLAMAEPPPVSGPKAAREALKK